MADALKVLTLVCTLSPSPTDSSSDLLGRQLVDAMPGEVESTVVRVVDHDVKPGVQVDMGEGDAWPRIREQLMAADILVMATPTWLGQHSSVCQRVLERLDAELSETDDDGRPLVTGKVAVGAIVGNEDGAHHITGILWQALNDVGFTVPAQGVTYWNDELTQVRDYKDLDSTPDPVTSSTQMAAAHAVHLARLLRERPYPPVG